MKNLIFSLLPLALVSANPIERRQATEAEKADEWPILPLLLALGEKVNGNASAVTPSLIVSALPQAKLAKVEETQSPLRKTAKRLVASYGPYVLVGKNVSSCAIESALFAEIAAGAATEIYGQFTGPKGPGLSRRHLGWFMFRLHRLGSQNQT